MIMTRLSAEEYIVATIQLYLDIINLFIEILKILEKVNRKWLQHQKHLYVGLIVCDNNDCQAAYSFIFTKTKFMYFHEDK